MTPNTLSLTSFCSGGKVLGKKYNLKITSLNIEFCKLLENTKILCDKQKGSEHYR